MVEAPILEAHDLKVWYGSFQALKGVSLHIERNAVTALIGASGSGKSTFLRCLNRMIDTVPGTRTEGSILFNGSDILSPATEVIPLRRRVGMLFQNPVPFPKSIYDNVAYGLEIQGMRNPLRSKWWRRRSAEDIEASDQPMDKSVVQSLKDAALWDEVKHRLDGSAYGLSGGQQQRLCIARAIAVKPEVLLLDEPCSELDPISTHHIEQTLLALQGAYTIVIVTHNLPQARRISARTAFFHAGELVEYGTTQQMFEAPAQTLTREYVGGHFG